MIEVILLERYVIGAMLIKPTLFAECKLTLADFSSEAVREVFNAIGAVHSAGQPIELFSVANQLKQATDKDWFPLLAEIVKQEIPGANFQGACKQIQKSAYGRKAKAAAAILLETIDSNPQAVDQAILALMTLNTVDTKYNKTMKQAANEAVVKLVKVWEGQKLPGITSGIRDVDLMFGGFHDSEFYVVAARSAIGKTAFMLNLLCGCNVSAGVITTEQPAAELATRMFSINGDINANKLRHGMLDEDDWDKLTKVCNRLSAWNIHHNEDPTITAGAVWRQAREWKHRYDIKILFVDYLQRLVGDRKLNRTELVMESARAMKNIARELNIPVIALAQVNRNVDHRADKRPGSADISDCSDIEKESDGILIIYRDDVYNAESPEKGIAELIVTKNRHGPIGTVKTSFTSHLLKFGDINHGNR